MIFDFEFVDFSENPEWKATKRAKPEEVHIFSAAHVGAPSSMEVPRVILVAAYKELLMRSSF